MVGLTTRAVISSAAFAPFHSCEYRSTLSKLLMVVKFIHWSPSITVLDKDMGHHCEAVDLNAIPQLEAEVGLEFGEGFPDWAYNIETAMYQPMISTPPDTPRSDRNISTMRGTEQFHECSALSSPRLCEASPRQIERVRTPSLCHCLSAVF